MTFLGLELLTICNSSFVTHEYMRIIYQKNPPDPNILLLLSGKP